ncbi:MAG TPA: cation:dicarboxylase symporter family transporter, partial [Blastocatellia bacterium]|nr:cation:dicarboxylase symporter family transporter [Blastocatellia bacterium]
MTDEKNEDLEEPALEADAYEREETTDLKDATPDRPKGWPLHTRILIGLVVGVSAGIASNAMLGGDHPRIGWIVTNITEPIGQLFLRLLLMTVIPLVFSSLVVGVAGIGDVRKLGRVGLKCLVYTIVISAISVVIGLTLANTVRPGNRIDPATAAALQERYGSDASKQVEDAKKAGPSDSVLMTVIKTIVPTNPIAAIAGVKRNPADGDTPNMIHLMFFALILGIAVTMVSASVSAPFVRGLEALYEISAKIIDIIMKLAPYAVACLLFNNTARFGLDLLGALAWFVVTVLAGLALHMFG